MSRLPSEPVYLDYNVLEQPFVAIHLATKELARLGRMAFDMIVTAQRAFIGNDSAAVKQVMATEETVECASRQDTGLPFGHGRKGDEHGRTGKHHIRTDARGGGYRAYRRSL